jgi:putative membrane protein
MRIMCALLLPMLISLGFAQTAGQGSANRMTPEISDRTFLLNAIQASRSEVDNCRVAISKATHRKIRAYAETMADTQTKFSAELERLARQKGITVPPRRPSIPLPLTQLNGKAFDRNYGIITVENQDKTLTAFQDEARLGADPDIKSFAARAIPSLMDNLDLARDLKH